MKKREKKYNLKSENNPKKLEPNTNTMENTISIILSKTMVNFYKYSYSLFHYKNINNCHPRHEIRTNQIKYVN